MGLGLEGRTKMLLVSDRLVVDLHKYDTRAQDSSPLCGADELLAIARKVADLDMMLFTDLPGIEALPPVRVLVISFAAAWAGDDMQLSLDRPLAWVAEQAASSGSELSPRMCPVPDVTPLDSEQRWLCVDCRADLILEKKLYFEKKRFICLFAFF